MMAFWERLIGGNFRSWTRELEARLRHDRLQRSATENVGASAGANALERAGARTTWG